MKNKPNIISNKLDQVPKTGKHYFERLQNPELKKQIIDAMSVEFVVGNDENEEINNKMVERLGVHEKEIPFNFLINQLSNYKKVSYLYNKNAFKGSEKSRFNIGPIEGIKYQVQILGAPFNKEGERLSEGEIGTFFTFERNEYGQIIIGAEQIEIPEDQLLFMEGLVFHKKMELSEFLEFIKNEKSENINKETQSEEIDDCLIRCFNYYDGMVVEMYKRALNSADTESQEKDSGK